MDNFTSYQHLDRVLNKLIKKFVETEDDAIVYEAFTHDDIHHAYQAIRECSSGEVAFQHLTQRFGSKGEQSVFQFDISDELKYCLDLYSIYQAIRQIRFQMDTFHPDLVSDVVVPLNVNSLLWAPGVPFFRDLLKYHGVAFKHIVPSLQIDLKTLPNPEVEELIERLREKIEVLSIWFEVTPPAIGIDKLAVFKPEVLKLAISFSDKHERAALLPVIRFIRRYKMNWVAGRVGSQAELTQYKTLGAYYYFGYFSDIPTQVSFKNTVKPVNKTKSLNDKGKLH